MTEPFLALSLPLLALYRDASCSRSFRPAGVASRDRSSCSRCRRVFVDVIGNPDRKGIGTRRGRSRVAHKGSEESGTVSAHPLTSWPFRASMAACAGSPLSIFDKAVAFRAATGPTGPCRAPETSYPNRCRSCHTTSCRCAISCPRWASIRESRKTSQARSGPMPPHENASIVELEREEGGWRGWRQGHHGHESSARPKRFYYRPVGSI